MHKFFDFLDFHHPGLWLADLIGAHAFLDAATRFPYSWLLRIVNLCVVWKLNIYKNEYKQVAAAPSSLYSYTYNHG